MSTASTPIEQQLWALQQLGDATRGLREAERVLDEYQQAPGEHWTRLSFHYVATDNPHGVTKTQVGLGSVMNYPMATAQQAVEGLSNQSYLSPRTAHNALVSFFATLKRRVYEETSATIANQHVQIDPTAGYAHRKTINTPTDIALGTVPMGRVAEATLVLTKNVPEAPVVRVGDNPQGPQAMRHPSSDNDAVTGVFLYTFYVGHQSVPMYRVEAFA